MHCSIRAAEWQAFSPHTPCAAPFTTNARTALKGQLSTEQNVPPLIIRKPAAPRRLLSHRDLNLSRQVRRRPRGAVLLSNRWQRGLNVCVSGLSPSLQSSVGVERRMNFLDGLVGHLKSSN